MKAITLWQPWATLIAVEEKRYETRSWPTNYRGPLAIHAAKRQVRREELDSWITGTLERHGYRNLQRMPRGVVLCIVRLVDVLPTEEVVAMAENDRRLKLDELHFGDYRPGRFAWKLQLVKRFEEPIPARGFQGLWDWTPPAHIVESLKQEATSS